MKLTDPDIIKEGEKDLIDAIKDDLDLDSINEIIKDKLKVKNLESKGGKIIVHNNEIAFQIEFELRLNGSLMFDRDGNYIPDDNNNGAIEDLEDSEDKEVEDKEVEEAEADDEDNIEDEEPESGAKTGNEEDKVEEGKSKEDAKKIAPELETENNPIENDFSDDSDSDELSEIDLDIDSFEDEDEDEIEIDFSDDEDIDDILKESREFWDNKKK